MLQACAQAVDFKVGHHFGEGQPSDDHLLSMVSQSQYPRLS
jgi:hypothetical protein